VFQHGAFGAQDTALTAWALLLYLPGLPAAAIDQLLIFAFYARRDTVTPVLVGVAAIGVYLVVALALIGPLGMGGLVLANSAQWVAHCLIMTVVLWRTMGDLRRLAAGTTIRRSAVLCAAMAGVMLAILRPAEARLDMSSFVVNAGLVAGVGVCGIVVFAAGALWWRMEEMSMLRGALRRDAR